jgi:hypothetical protein
LSPGPPACAPAPAEGKAKKCSRKSSSEPPGCCWPAMAGDRRGWGTPGSFGWLAIKERLLLLLGSVASQEGEAAFGVFFSKERERVREGEGFWTVRLCLGPAGTVLIILFGTFYFVWDFFILLSILFGTTLPFLDLNHCTVLYHFVFLLGDGGFIPFQLCIIGELEVQCLTYQITTYFTHTYQKIDNGSDKGCYQITVAG